MKVFFCCGSRSIDQLPLIGRYDGRGHLHDLSDYDSQSTWNRDNRVTEEEARIDALCDEERYLALHVDLIEEAARQGVRCSSLWIRTMITVRSDLVVFVEVFIRPLHLCHCGGSGGGGGGGMAVL